MFPLKNLVRKGLRVPQHDVYQWWHYEHDPCLRLHQLWTEDLKYWLIWYLQRGHELFRNFSLLSGEANIEHISAATSKDNHDDTKLFILENAFENFICKMLIILCQPRWVHWPYRLHTHCRPWWRWVHDNPRPFARSHWRCWAGGPERRCTMHDQSRPETRRDEINLPSALQGLLLLTYINSLAPGGL